MACAGRAQEISITTSFSDLGLSSELLRAVAEQGYTQPTPVQAQAIPAVLSGRDLLAGAQTGTGKTAGFTLPLLQRLSAPRQPSARRTLRSLILVPTRELAVQVEESVRTYGAHLPLKSTTVVGGVSMQGQIQALRRGVDILVATPGRLLDHVGQRTLDLSQIEILVLDEADRMLDLGFIHAIRRIVSLLPAQRQNLLFSATFSAEVKALANGFMQAPTMIEVEREDATSELISQLVHPVDSARKRELLAHLVSSGDWRQVLVFTRTKHGANRLAEQLSKDGITADAIHGNKSQSRRTRALAEFKSGVVRVLVATDIAARGLDIEELPHVVNFDLPHVPEDYVHRIGRTGRAGSAGTAISLVSAEERSLLAGIERLTRLQIERQIIAGFEPGRNGTARPGHEERAAESATPYRGNNRTSAQRPHRPQQRASAARPGNAATGDRSGFGRDRGGDGMGNRAASGRNSTGEADGNRTAGRNRTGEIDGNRAPRPGSERVARKEGIRGPDRGSSRPGQNAGARRSSNGGGDARATVAPRSPARGKQGARSAANGSGSGRGFGKKLMSVLFG